MASPGKKSFLLRLDPQVWAQLERLAAADLRSVNAEVEFLLREALKRRGVAPGPGSHSDGSHSDGSRADGSRAGGSHPTAAGPASEGEQDG